MKIKLDENLPAALAESLKTLGHDVQTTLDEGLKGRDDSAIWRAAQAESRFLITQDLDFLIFASSLLEPMPAFFWSACASPAGKIWPLWLRKFSELRVLKSGKAAS